LKDNKLENPQFTLEFKVRDYECDIQGVVNNSVYQNYLEHARHEFLLSIGIDFAELANRNINLVVFRAELDYKSPLKSGDKFVVQIKLIQTSPLRFCFEQEIFRLPDNKLSLKAKIFGTAINEKGKPFLPEEIKKAIKSMEN